MSDMRGKVERGSPGFWCLLLLAFPSIFPLDHNERGMQNLMGGPKETAYFGEGKRKSKNPDLSLSEELRTAFREVEKKNGLRASHCVGSELCLLFLLFLEIPISAMDLDQRGRRHETGLFALY